LVGNNYTISFKLEQEDPSEAIELDKLSLRINDLMVGDPRIATNNHNPARILEDMGRINIRLNQTISLTIQPGGVNKAAFSMHLFYGGIPLGPKQTFTWTADRAAKPTLCDAAEIDDINLLKQLLAVPGVQVNATNEGGDTALHIYAQKYNPEAIRLLIDNGADVNLVKNSTYAPWYTAPLNIAARYSNQAVINQILQVPGVNVNFKDSSGRTPLHSLVGSSTNQATVESMKQLIAKGADVNAINMWGATPLHNAVSHPTRWAFVEELLKAPGIHIDAKDHDGNTPLHLAVEEESVAIIKLLLDKGAQQDIRNKKGKTALDLAATSADEEIKKLFNI
jgi:ankyrin repeat protein